MRVIAVKSGETTLYQTVSPFENPSAAITALASGLAKRGHQNIEVWEGTLKKIGAVTLTVSFDAK